MFIYFCIVGGRDSEWPIQSYNLLGLSAREEVAQPPSQILSIPNVNAPFFLLGEDRCLDRSGTPRGSWLAGVRSILSGAGPKLNTGTFCVFWL